jgi:type II secretory pathway component PulK
MKLRRHRRSGIVLLMVLVLLGAVTTLFGVLTILSVQEHRFLIRRESQMQADWLARGGIENARALIDSGKEPTDQTWKPLPQAEVKLRVSKKDGVFEVASEASYPMDEPKPAQASREAKLTAKAARK